MGRKPKKDWVLLHQIFWPANECHNPSKRYDSVVIAKLSASGKVLNTKDVPFGACTIMMEEDGERHLSVDLEQIPGISRIVTQRFIDPSDPAPVPPNSRLLRHEVGYQ